MTKEFLQQQNYCSVEAAVLTTYCNIFTARC